MADALSLVIAGEPMRLLADRALFWPARRRLLIADLHLGKGNAFRRAGIAVPSGGMRHDLARLSRLIEQTSAQSLWILGDMLHGAMHHEWQAGWQAWRERHADVRIGVVAGNHDRALDTSVLQVEALAAEVSDGPFLFCHEPQATATQHVVCGHVHPVLRLPRSGLRPPVFWLRERMSVLPAFSAFTGGHAVTLSPGEAAIACNGREIVDVGKATLMREAGG